MTTHHRSAKQTVNRRVLAVIERLDVALQTTTRSDTVVAQALHAIEQAERGPQNRDDDDYLPGIDTAHALALVRALLPYVEAARKRPGCEGCDKDLPAGLGVDAPGPVAPRSDRELATAVNALLHQALGTAPCESACTHIVSGRWTALGVANVVGRRGGGPVSDGERAARADLETYRNELLGAPEAVLPPRPPPLEAIDAAIAALGGQPA